MKVTFKTSTKKGLEELCNQAIESPFREPRTGLGLMKTFGEPSVRSHTELDASENVINK